MDLPLTEVAPVLNPSDKEIISSNKDSFLTPQLKLLSKRIDEETLIARSLAGSPPGMNNLNPDFMNVDHELEVPDGEGGPSPVYVLPNAQAMPLIQGKELVTRE